MNYYIENGKISGTGIEMECESLYVGETVVIVHKDSEQVFKVFDEIINFKGTGGN